MTPLPGRLVSAALVAIAIMSGGCSDSATNPSTVPPPATIRTLSIGGLPPEFTVGESAQLRATATWTDNRNEDVTARTRWSSKTLSCVVTPDGRVSALETGNCAIDASLEAATAAVTVTIGASRFVTLTGVVRERFESGEPPIPGAVITVKSGPEAGRRVVADDRGRYVLERMPKASVTVEFGGTGFESQPIVLSPDSPSRDVLLVPHDVLIEWSDQPGLTGDRVTFPFEVTHRGPFVMSARSTVHVCGTYETFGVYIRNADKDVIVSHLSPCTVGVVSSTNGFLDRGRYEFVAWTQFGLGGTARSASLTHPR